MNPLLIALLLKHKGLPPGKATMPGQGSPMQPDMTGPIQRGEQAGIDRMYDEANAEELAANNEPNAEELAANNEPYPERGRPINKRNIGPLLIGQLLSSLLLKDREGQFTKGAMGVIEAQENQKFEDQVQRLQQKKQERLIKARQTYDLARRKEGNLQFEKTQAFNERKLGEDTRQFNVGQQTELEKARIGAGARVDVAEIAASGRLTAAQWKELMKQPPGNRANFARTVLGVTDPDFLANADKLSPGENLTNAKIKTEKERPALIKEQALHLRLNSKLIPLRAEKLAKDIYWMDKEKATAIGLSEARIEDLKALTASRPNKQRLEWAKLNADQLKQANAEIANGFATITAESNGLRTLIGNLENNLAKANELEDEELREEETVRLKAEIKTARERLGALNKVYTGNAVEVNKLRKQLGLQGNDVIREGFGSPFEQGGGPEAQGIGARALSGARAANRNLGYQIFSEAAQRHGWSEAEWNALDQLWGTHESGWNNKAQNPRSTARGIAQFLDSTWKSVGMTKTDDPAMQIKAGLAYIKNRYGSPSNALAFWKRRVPINGKDVGNWY